MCLKEDRDYLNDTITYHYIDVSSCGNRMIRLFMGAYRIILCLRIFLKADFQFVCCYGTTQLVEFQLGKVLQFQSFQGFLDGLL